MDGEFAISGTFPTIQDIIDFKEGTANFQYGYYRFIPHPYLKTAQSSLREHFGARYVVLYNSLQTGLAELLRYLDRAPRTESVHIYYEQNISALPAIEDITGSETFNSIEVSIFSIDEFTGQDAFDRTRWAIIAVEQFGNYDTVLEQSDYVPSRRDNIAVLAAKPSNDPIDVKKAKLWLTPLNKPDSPIRGAAIFGNAERQLMELGQRTKRRGYYLSSRNARALLDGESVTESVNVVESVKNRIAELEDGTDTFLFPSGMNAIQTVLDILRTPEKQHVISIGHLYRDTFTTLKNAPIVNAGPENTFLGVDEIETLERHVTPSTACIITESITNPLNDVPDLELIQSVARKHDIPVVVDNTIATPYNCKPFDFGADFVIHSTTKFLNGKNNHAGGAVIVREGKYTQALNAYQHRWDNSLSPLEVEVLQQNIRDFPERMERFNANAWRLVELLQSQLQVKEVFYNGLESHRTYDAARRILSDSSSVVSFTLQKDSLEGLRAFYDQDFAHIDKAPTLGSDHTLICLYTLLTHYEEPEEYLKEVNLPRYLIRIAVGSEKDFQPVLDSVQSAFDNLPD
ncbi:MAG: PLP-dependent transferase [Candidatus Marinimicrobia bacterium]|nr:PLP-dependent transferase [Candidatus Neomarinimicrobiota bacterium]